jgi:hypothetical protein
MKNKNKTFISDILNNFSQNYIIDLIFSAIVKLILEKLLNFLWSKRGRMIRGLGSLILSCFLMSLVPFNWILTNISCPFCKRRHEISFIMESPLDEMKYLDCKVALVIQQHYPKLLKVVIINS